MVEKDERLNTLNSIKINDICVPICVIRGKIAQPSHLQLSKAGKLTFATQVCRGMRGMRFCQGHHGV